MVGRLKISKLRCKAQKTLEPKYVICGLHDTALKSEPVQLDVPEEQVDGWIASRK
jgi:uncharacterized protein (DUF885 family)